MGGTGRMNEEVRKPYESYRQYGRKQPLGRLRHGWDEQIEVGLKVVRMLTESVWSMWTAVTNCQNCSDVLSVCVYSVMSVVYLIEWIFTDGKL